MKTVKNLLTKLVKDEQGGEVLEYALIAGLIVVAAIAVIGSVGTKVLAKLDLVERRHVRTGARRRRRRRRHRTDQHPRRHRVRGRRDTR